MKTIKEKFDEVGVRPEVLRFAVAMENTLRLHDDKGGWSKCSSKYLLSRMKDEIHELENALAFPGIPAPIRNEAVDVANFAMMLYDIFHWRQRKMEAPSPEYCEGCDHWVGGACTSPDQDCHPETHEPSDDIPLERNDA